MKKIFFIAITVLFLVVTAGGMAGCYEFNGSNDVTGSQNLETREFTYSDFTKVEVSSPFQVEISKSNVYSVSITANENLFDYIEVTQISDTLHLRLKPFFSFRHTTFEAVIAMPELNALNISGACTTEIGEFQTIGDVDIEVSGASKLNIVGLQASNVIMEVSGASRVTGYVKSESADFEVSGASSLELRGSSVDASLDVSGASSLRLQDFSILEASISLSAASNGSVEVNGNLDVEVSGVSSLIYSGNPTLGRVEVSGASSLRRR